MWPNRRVSSVYNAMPVFFEENASVDSIAMSPIQTAAGHQARARFGRDPLILNPVAVKRSLVSFRRVVRSFARNHHVVHVAFAQAGGADAHEPRLLLQFGHRLAS